MSETKEYFAVVDEVEEDEFVVLVDDGPKLIVNRKYLPAATREGTVLRVTLTIDEAEREKRISRVRNLQQELLNRTRGGK